MLFKVSGVDSLTREVRVVTVMASDSADAVAKAQKLGVEEESAEPVPERTKSVDDSDVAEVTTRRRFLPRPFVDREKAVRNRRVGVGACVAAIHFAVSLVLVGVMLVEAMSPIPDPDLDWLVPVMWIVLFPASMCAAFGAFAEPILLLILVPLNSLLWGWVSAYWFVRD